MKYSLITHRKYGNFMQKVTVVKNKSGVNNNALTELKRWADLLPTVDNTDWDTGLVVCDTFTSVVTGESGNQGQLATVVIQVVCEVAQKPYLTTIELYDVTLANFSNVVINAVTNALGVNMTNTKTGIISATFDLH